jgi:uroporphyrinogen-III synthase
MIAPLTNRRIVLTRAREQADELAEQLTALGAEPLLCPAIDFAPPADRTVLDTALQQLNRYTWMVLTSATAVRILAERSAELGTVIPSTVKLAVVGPATAQELVHYGWQATFQPSTAHAEALANELPLQPGERILFPRAELAQPTIVAGLSARGALVDDPIAYRTVPGAGPELLARYLQLPIIDAITFTSSSTVQYTFNGLLAAGMSIAAVREQLSNCALISIGPATSSTLRALGLQIAAEANPHTSAGIIAALCTLFAEARIPGSISHQLA